MKLEQIIQVINSRKTALQGNAASRWLPATAGRWKRRDFEAFNRHNPFDRNAVAALLSALQQVAAS